MSRTAQRREPAEVPAPVSRFRVNQPVRLIAAAFRAPLYQAERGVGHVEKLHHAGIIGVRFGARLENFHNGWLEAAE